MKKVFLIILNISLTIILLVGCSNFSEKSSENSKGSINEMIENSDKSVDEKSTIEPTIAQWSLEKDIGADMVKLDYASDDIVIFHGYFGLFVYDLNNLKIIKSLDLKSINCSATQGDEYCEVKVSEDGNTVQLHTINNKQMYIYSVSDNTLCETNYSQMENAFENKFVDVEKAVDSHNAFVSYNAVEFQSGDYGYLITDDWTLGTLKYIRGDRQYLLFRS